MNTRIAIAQEARVCRRRLERSWGDDTAHWKYRPLPEGKPVSFGQCFGSIVVFQRELLATLPHEKTRLVSGDLLRRIGNGAMRTVIAGHTWLTWQYGQEGDKKIISDLTVDQADGDDMPPYIVASHGYLASRGIIYQPWDGWAFDTAEAHIDSLPDDIQPKFLDRVELLQARYDEQKLQELSL